MEEFLRKVVNGAGIAPPLVSSEAFKDAFPDAVNPEWSNHEDGYEVLFHKDAIEHIAHFDEHGALLKYKMYLSKALLPTLIRTSLEEDWEIMNAVMTNAGHEISYEIIVRNASLERYLIHLDYLGNKIKQRPL